jgi:hypothetical protein
MIHKSASGKWNGMIPFESRARSAVNCYNQAISLIEGFERNGDFSPTIRRRACKNVWSCSECYTSG